MSVRTSILAAAVMAATLSVGCEEWTGRAAAAAGDRDRDGISDSYDRSPRRADDRLDRDDNV
jgi:hypothetical protein